MNIYTPSYLAGHVPTPDEPQGGKIFLKLREILPFTDQQGMFQYHIYGTRKTSKTLCCSHVSGHTCKSTHIFSTASDISAQNSSTMLFNLRNANAFSSGSLSSSKARIPAKASLKIEKGLHSYYMIYKCTVMIIHLHVYFSTNASIVLRLNTYA